MPFAISLVSGPGAVVTLAGLMNNADMAALDRAMLDLVATHRTLRYILVDGTKLTNSHLSTNQIRDSALNARATGIRLDLDIPILFVMPGELDYGQARMWSGFFAHDGKMAHIYKTREEAQAFMDSLDSGENGSLDSI